MAARVEALNLKADVKCEREHLTEVTVYATALAMNYLAQGKIVLGPAVTTLLLLPMMPGLRTTINGARIWIHLGPFSFQPGEVAKVLLVIAFAGYLVLHRDALALAGRRVLTIFGWRCRGRYHTMQPC